jgi:hypothetical protein
MTVNTKRVKDRRQIRFENFGDAIRDAETLAEAQRRGTLRATGNWSLGQAIGHVATWARFPLDGYPTIPRPPWFIRLMVPLFKGAFINKGMPPGVSIGDLPNGTLGTEPMDSDVAIRNLRESFGRLERETPIDSNPLLGQLSHDEWIKLNLRHAELHFSFFHPT